MCQSTNIGTIPPVDSDSDVVYDSDEDPEFIPNPDQAIKNNRKTRFPLLYCFDSDSSDGNFGISINEPVPQFVTNTQPGTSTQSVTSRFINNISIPKKTKINLLKNS